MKRRDPRLYQIAVLGALLVYGVAGLDFGVGPARVGLVLATCLLTQAACTRLWGLERFDPRSALISGLSLSLLLRTNDPALAALAAIVTIASKFVVRVDGRHVFNPTNFGLVVAMLLTGDVWVSPGQWGHTAFFGFLMACLGGVVVNRAARSDVTAAFLGFYVAIVMGRALWLGDPLALALHQLQSGALLLFAFFMISDPKTTPDTRAGRVLFACLVAAGAAYVQFRLFRTNGLLWALFLSAPIVPLINRCLPGSRYTWTRATADVGLPALPAGFLKEFAMRVSTRFVTLAFVVALALGATATPVSAFCGFYVSKADTKIFNRASQVVLVRDGDRTVLTMANDFRGDPEEFAVVIPVPTVLERDQIHVGNKRIIDHLDAYSAPRLVEYFDENPCAYARRERFDAAAELRPVEAPASNEARNRALGVAVEATYTVGEYDIVILSAVQSDGLETWLTENGYSIPAGARAVLGSYIRQNLKFFVARVNLEEQSQLGFTYLRPLQIAYESPRFMLPIRLGTVNAQGSQDLFVFALTRQGRIETTNYRTVKLPTGMDLPVYLKDGKEFGAFYQAMFSQSVEQENRRGVFLEYAWDMTWCDPCAADPLSNDELRQLGVFWAGNGNVPDGGAQPDVFITRLHVRYDAEHFPEDLIFQETSDRTNFQGRYVLRHPWMGDLSCAAAREYRRTLSDRFEREAQTLASLTGWDIQDIRRKMGTDDLYPLPDERPWWRRLWNQN